MVIMDTFGSFLRYYRKVATDPLNGNPLSQARFAELLNVSIATVSYWENNQRYIPAQDRPLLLSLLEALSKHGGIQSLAEANALLEAGEYRALNKKESERLQHFYPQPLPETAATTVEVVPTVPLGPADQHADTRNWLALLFHVETAPDESRLAALVWYLFDRPIQLATPDGLLRLLGMGILWIAATWSWSLLWRWPYANIAIARQSLIIWIVASGLIPLFLGLIIQSDRQAFLEQKTPSHKWISLHRTIGASMGYSVGLAGVVLLGLILYYLRIWPVPRGLTALLALLPLLPAYAAARRTPYNMFRAFQPSRGESLALRPNEDDLALILGPVMVLGMLAALIYFGSDTLLNRIQGPIGLFLIAFIVLLLLKRYNPQDFPDLLTKMPFLLVMMIGVAFGALLILNQGIFILLGTGLIAVSILLYLLLTCPGTETPPLLPILISVIILGLITLLTRYNIRAGLITITIFVVVELVIYRRNLRAWLPILLLAAAFIVAIVLLRFQTVSTDQVYSAYALLATALVVWQIWRNRRARRALAAAAPPPTDESPPDAPAA